MKSVLFWVFVGFVALVGSEVINNTPCDTGRDADILGTTSEISVEPCAAGTSGEPCELHRGTNAIITIKFTPSITPSSSQKFKSTIAWVRSTTDANFRGMRPDACANYMTCPLKANEEVIFKANLTLASNLPTGHYPLKVKVAEQNRRKRVVACQLFDINLTDPN